MIFKNSYLLKIPYSILLKRFFHFRQKVDAGADFVVTQFFLEVEPFENFLADCRSNGITVPILPGILLFKVRMERYFRLFLSAFLAITYTRFHNV